MEILNKQIYKLMIKISKKIKNFNAIGLDIDNTFMRFKQKNMINLVCNAVYIYLADFKNYPKRIFPHNQEFQEQISPMFFRAIYDYGTGNLLKVAQDDTIFRGYHGLQQLDKDDIERIYGKERKFSGIDVVKEKQSKCYFFNELYGASKVPLIANIIQVKRQGTSSVLNKKSYKEIFDDFYEALKFNINSNNFINQPQFQKKYYIPEILRQKQKYIYKINKQLLSCLKQLRKNGIQLFIISNNHASFSNELLKYQFDDQNWEKYFDFCVFRANKPNFFMEHNDFDTIKGKHTDFIKHIENSKTINVLNGGNAADLNKYFETQFGKDFKILFFGDTIGNDFLFTRTTALKNWKFAFIFEELQELIENIDQNEFYDYRSKWGSALFDIDYRGHIQKTKFFDFVTKNFDYVFPHISSSETIEFLKSNV